MVNGQGSGANLRATVRGRSRARTAALLSVSIAAIAISLAGPALATSTTYNGNGTSSDWSDAANWSAGVPGSHYDINLVQTGSHAPTNFDISNTFSSLTLETPTDATTLANGYTVGGSGTFTAIDNFVLVDSAQNASADHLNMNIALDGATDVHVLGSAGGLAFGGTISGGGSLIFDNGNVSAIVLSGSNTYSGGTTLSHGALSISSDANLGNGGTLVLKDGTELDITATGAFAHAVTVAGDPTFNVASGTTTTWTGQITDGATAGDVEVNGGGTLALTNTSNSYSGGTVVKGGSTLLIDDDGELGATTGGLTLGNATTTGTLQLGASFDLASTRAITLGAGGGTIDTNGFDTTISQEIGGTGALSETGGGTLTLTNTANSYSGGTVVKGGSTLVIDDDAELGATTGGLTLGDATTSGTLQYASGFVISDTRAITLGAGGGTIDINGNTTLISQAITGDGGLTVVNSGGPEFFALTGTNTYLGGTTIGPLVKLTIGNHGTTGSIVGDVLDNGQLIFDRTDSVVVFSGNISGSGGVSAGGGSGSAGVVFTGTNTYSGLTTIESSLTLGDGVTAGTITSDVGMLVSSNKLIFDEPTDVTFAGRIGGLGQVVIEGPGAITLTNTSNLYVGGTVVKGGSTLVIDDDAELGATTGGLTLGDATTSGTLQLGANVTLANTRAVSLGAGGGTIDINGQTILISQGITGAGGLTLINSGLAPEYVVLTGTNTYGGGTTIGSNLTLHIGDHTTTGSIIGDVLDNGRLVFGRTDTGVVFAGDISGSGTVNIAEGGVVFTGTNTYSGTTTIGGSLTLGDGTTAGTITSNVAMLIGSSTLTFDEPTDVTFAGSIAGLGHVVIDGPGIITLTGSSTNYFGNTKVVSGGLSISADANIGDSSSSLELDNGTTLYTTATGTFTNDVTVAGDPTFNVASGTTTTWSGQITDGATAGDVEVDGGGTLALTNTANSYSGGTVVKGGSTLEINADSELGNTSGSLTLGDLTTAGTFKLGTHFNLSNTRAISLGAGGGTLDTSGFETTISQGISGTGKLTIEGLGQVVLTGTNTYTGGTIVSSNDLIIGQGGTTGSIVGDVTVGVTSSSVTLGFQRSDNIAFAGNVSGLGSVDQNGSGTLTLSGINTNLGGVAISQGTLAVGADNNLGDSSAHIYFLGTASSLKFLSSFQSAREIDLVCCGSAAFDTNGNTDTLSGLVTGVRSFIKKGAGTLILSGTNNYTGGTTISTGTLQIGDGGTTGSVTGNIADNGTLVFDRSNAASFAGAISGSGALQQNGSGNLTLSGTSTLTGATTVNAGTLSVNGSIASSTVTVNSGAKLGGTGTVGATTVASGGTLAPGNSVGTLHVSGNLALNSGANTVVEISPSTADEVIVTGTASLSGQLLASFATGSYTPGALYTLINSTGLLSGTFTSFDTLGIPSGYSASLSYDAHDVFLTLNPNAFVWSATPGTSDWNTGSNWKYGSVPGSSDVAEFDTTSGPTVIISQADSVKSLWFDAAAPAYAINIAGSASGAASLTLTGGGIANDSTNVSTVTVSGVSGDAGTLTFASTGNAANANIVAGNYGTVLFQGTSDAGTSATLTAQSGGTVDFSGTTGAAGDKKISAGSIAGAGTYSLGGNALTVGSLNTSTEVSGVIADGGSAGGTGASLTKVGTGTLILSGTNSYTGSTVVSEGTLQIGDGSAGGSIAGDIVDNATLSFDRSDTYTFGGVISGTGAVKQIGSGTAVLSGVSTYNGPTTISAGILDVNGSIARSAVTLNGGQLKGSGTVGSVTAGSGSSVAPGNSIGTLNVAGNVTFAAGSTYQVELNATGASDLISATGTAVLQGGTVQALPAAGSYLPISTYRIVNATGGVSGTFASVTSSESTLTPSLLYSANAVDLRMIRNDLQFGGYGYTPNQKAAGAGVSAGGVGSELYVTMATVALTPSAVPPALDALSGEIHASIRSTLIEDDRVVRQSILDRLSGSSGDGIVVWGDGFVSSGGVDGDGNAATMNHDNAGVIAGVDMALSHSLRAGLAGAYTEHKISIADRASTARGQSGHIAGYARWAQDAWSVSGGVDYGWGNSNIARQVKFTGLSESDVSKQGHDTTQVFAEAGYTMTAGGARFEPYADLAWIQASSGAFAETGGALSDLTGSGRSDAVAYATAGVRVMPGQFALGDVVFTPSAAVGWQHAIDDFRPGQTVSYAATLKSFTVLGVPLDSDAAVTQAGIDVNLGGQGKLSVLYDGVLSNKVRDHTLRAQFGWTF